MRHKASDERISNQKLWNGPYLKSATDVTEVRGIDVLSTFPNSAVLATILKAFTILRGACDACMSFLSVFVVR